MKNLPTLYVQHGRSNAEISETIGTPKKLLLQDIAIVEKRLKALEAQKNGALEKLNTLKRQLADLETQATVSTSSSLSPIAKTTLTAENKIDLFRKLLKVATMSSPFYG